MLPAGSLCPNVPSFSEEETTERFHRMIDAYHLSQHAWPFRWHSYNLITETFAVIDGSVYNPTEWDGGCYCFVLQRKNPDNRRVRSFKAQLFLDASCNAFEVGWLRYSLGKVSADMISDGNEIHINIVQDFGLGTIIDEEYSHVQVHGEVVTSTTGDPIVRCANGGAEWYIDGKQFASTKDLSRSSYLSGSQPFFRINGKGS